MFRVLRVGAETRVDRASRLFGEIACQRVVWINAKTKAHTESALYPPQLLIAGDARRDHGTISRRNRARVPGIRYHMVPRELIVRERSETMYAAAGFRTPTHRSFLLAQGSSKNKLGFVIGVKA